MTKNNDGKILQFVKGRQAEKDVNTKNPVNNRVESNETGDTEEWAASARMNGHEAKPVVIENADIHCLVDTAEKLLLLGDMGIYQRAGMLCRLVSEVRHSRGLDRSTENLIIIGAEAAWLREKLSEVGRWVRVTAAGTIKEVLPPAWLVKALIARRQWKFPVLAGLVETPILRPDGSVFQDHGYDRQTCLYRVPTDTHFPPIPAHVRLDDVRHALAQLSEIFVDFPFKSESGRSAALAAVLTVVARHLVDGCVPVFPVDAPTPGTGKSLLVDAIATLATGTVAPRWVQAENDAEERKRLTTIGLEGDRIVLIDNVERPFGGAPMAAAITAGHIKDRLLGRNRAARTPWETVVFVTGNNLTFVGDMARRVVPIYLDPGVENPEERTGFVHDPLLVWIRHERGRLVTAALTVLSAFISAGMPAQEMPAFGSFETWSRLIRGALVWAGMPDPAGDRVQLRMESDVHWQHRFTVLSGLVAIFGSRPGTVREIVSTLIGLENRGRDDQAPDSEQETAQTAGQILDALTALDHRGNGTNLNIKRVPYILRSLKDRIVGGFVLRTSAQRGNAGVQWFVEKIE